MVLHDAPHCLKLGEAGTYMSLHPNFVVLPRTQSPYAAEACLRLEYVRHTAESNDGILGLWWAHTAALLALGSKAEIKLQMLYLS